MNISVWAISISSVCYLTVSIDLLVKKDYQHSLMWFSYMVANLAMLWYEVEKWNNSK